MSQPGLFRFGAAIRRLPVWLLAALVGLSNIVADETDYIFQSTNLIHIRIDIPPEGVLALAEFRREPRVRVSATVSEGGTVYSNVLVQLKGRGTFQPIHARPSLTLRFGKGSDTRTFHGLKRISLNNAAQDPTCLQEKLARELFASAGVPSARADHARVTLNGRDLGVYVLTEGYDKTFLKRHFQNPDGTFFDGGLFTDVNSHLEIVSGAEGNFAGLERAALACLEADEELRFAALQKSVDVDRFLSLIAMETILCHWDGYAMRRTNYRVYHDPESNKLVFMPQGMDRILGNFRRHLDLPLAPPMVGMVARALLGTEEGRRLYMERVESLFTKHFVPEKIIQRVRQMDQKIAADSEEPGVRWETNPNDLNRVVTLGSHAKDIDDLCMRISTRAALLRSFIEVEKKNPAVTPLISFEGTNIASLPPWSPRSAYLVPEARWEQAAVQGTNCWHVVAAGPYTALGCRVKLPSGNYRIAGVLRVAGSEGIPRVMLRHFVTPFTPEVQPLSWHAPIFYFRIGEGAAPEEIDILVEVRGKGEAWIDPESFRIRKVQ